MHNWDDFQYFLAVADEGSFSGAAKQLGVNHSTVSRRIQMLEQEHGVRLLERTQSGYEMTDAGVAIYDIATEIRSANQRISRVLMGQDARLAGKISLTMPHEIFQYYMAEPLQRYCAENPAISIDLQVSRGVRNLANREADMAIRLSPSPPDYLIANHIEYMQHGLYANQANAEKYADKDASEPTRIIVWSNQQEIPHWAQKHCTNPEIVLRVDDLYSMYNAVKLGYGLARIPCFLPDKIADSTVQRLPVALPRSDWSIWLLHHPDLRSTARIQHCKRFLQQELELIKPFSLGKFSEVINS
ncbi:LysR family transcriptional regulator [Maricurvus nonylphenolicus]|uniref:LysR family transcriptional regulator n=1 Tax=Maricurvus nonylphenolicus TaxID=1008307 RepID=UPI0036F42204